MSVLKGYLAKGLPAVALFAAMMAGAVIAQTSPLVAPPPGEEAVDPYSQTNANAGAAPITDPAVLAAFHGREGINRIVDDLVERVQHDKRTEGIFRTADFVRLRRTLKEQFCYLLSGGCDYTGRDMNKTHEDQGITPSEFNAVVELLQASMDREGVPFAMQNKLVAKLAPMKRDVVRRPYEGPR
jgi:hemoglobin